MSGLGRNAVSGLGRNAVSGLGRNAVFSCSTPTRGREISFVVLTPSPSWILMLFCLENLQNGHQKDEIPAAPSIFPKSRA